MDLLSIQDPSFLKKMSIEQLEELSEEIRNFLITSLSASGGHIGPNLGVVELTIALHKEFDSPKDKFLWDVGHQSYVHKLLTGRGKEFETLRQYKGLCGFPKRSESEHDVWETGHSSTSLSGAMGMAAARDIKGSKEYIIPIIGDGALTGGMALEALNHIGDEKKDMIVILNDNEMSIAPNVGAIHSMLGRLRTAGKYQWVKDELEYLFKRIPAVGGKLAATAERIKDSLKYMLVSGMFFEELGFTYLGPVDGHSYHELFENLQYAKKRKALSFYMSLRKRAKAINRLRPTQSAHGTERVLIKSIRVISSSRKPRRLHGADLSAAPCRSWRARMTELSRLHRLCRSALSLKDLRKNFLSACLTSESQNSMRRQWPREWRFRG